MICAVVRLGRAQETSADQLTFLSPISGYAISERGRMPEEGDVRHGFLSSLKRPPNYEIQICHFPLQPATVEL